MFTVLNTSNYLVTVALKKKPPLVVPLPLGKGQPVSKSIIWSMSNMPPHQFPRLLITHTYRRHAAGSSGTAFWDTIYVHPYSPPETNEDTSQRRRLIGASHLLLYQKNYRGIASPDYGLSEPNGSQNVNFEARTSVWFTIFPLIFDRKK